MTKSIINLLDPLQSAIAMQSWEDAEDIAKEISRMCYQKRLEGLQAIGEALNQQRDSYEKKTPPGALQRALQGTGDRSQESGTEPAFRPEPGITLETRFDEFGHSEQWRNELAKGLNLLLHHSQYFDPNYMNVTASIVARVAQFEEIQVKP